MLLSLTLVISKFLFVLWMSYKLFSQYICIFVAKAIKEVWQQRQNGWHLIDRAMFQESGREIIWMLSIRINPSSLQNIFSCEQQKGKFLKEFDMFELIEALCWGTAALAVLTGCWKEVWFCVNVWHICPHIQLHHPTPELYPFCWKRKAPYAEVYVDLKLPDAYGNLEMTLF